MFTWYVHEPACVIVAHLDILVMPSIYLPISLSRFIVYGNSVNSSILYSIPLGGLRTSAEAFITFNVIFAFLIVLNPLCLDLETLFRVPHSE